MTKPNIDPGYISRQAVLVLDVLRSDDEIEQDPSILAAVLRTAAESCAQVATHNLVMTSLAHTLAGRR